MNKEPFHELNRLFEEQGILKQYKKREFIFHLGESPNCVYFVKEGWVKVSREGEEGKGVTFFLRREGELLGSAEVFARIAERERFARCLTNCIIYSIQAEKLYQLIIKEPILFQALAAIISKRMLESQKTIENLINKPVSHRLAWFLTSVADKRTAQWEVKLPISHEEVSYILGCSRQKVTELLNVWASNKLIYYHRKQIIILSPDSFLDSI